MYKLWNLFFIRNICRVCNNPRDLRGKCT